MHWDGSTTILAFLVLDSKVSCCASLRSTHLRGSNRSSNPEHLQDFIPEVVDNLDGDLARLGGVEGVALGAVEGRPLGLVDLGAEGALELAVGVVGAEEVGVADEEALAVVVGVDESAGDVVGR